MRLAKRPVMQPKKGLVSRRGGLEISGKIGEPEGDIGHLAVTVRYPDATNDHPVGQDLDADASLVRQRKAVDAPPLRPRQLVLARSRSPYATPHFPVSVYRI